MKKILTLALFALFSVTSFAQSSLTTYSESGFAAKFAVAPQVVNQNIPTKLGDTPMTMYVSEGQDYVIMLSVNKFAEDIVKKLDEAGVQGLLNGSKNGAINNLAKQMGAEFKSVKEEKYLYEGKFPAHKVEGTINDTEVKANYIFKSNQLFQVLILGNTTSKEVTDFVASFKLI
ncbi:hypothetical protein [Flavobacterium pedocola]